MTAAAATILVLFDSTASAANMSTFASEVIGMTGCAVGCVLRIWPWNVAAYGIAMTGSTAGIPSVVTGVIAIAGVGKDVRNPGIG